jgi:hypothetical protein
VALRRTCLVETVVWACVCVCVCVCVCRGMRECVSRYEGVCMWVCMCGVACMVLHVRCCMCGVCGWAWCVWRLVAFA